MTRESAPTVRQIDALVLINKLGADCTAIHPVTRRSLHRRGWIERRGIGVTLTRSGVAVLALHVGPIPPARPDGPQPPADPFTGIPGGSHA